jgi:hypothetical protein
MLRTSCSKFSIDGYFLFNYTYPGRITERDLPNAVLTLVKNTVQTTTSPSEKREGELVTGQETVQTILVNGPLKNYLNYSIGTAPDGHEVLNQIAFNLPSFNAADTDRLSLSICVPPAGGTNCLAPGAGSAGGVYSLVYLLNQYPITKANFSSLSVELKVFYFVYPPTTNGLLKNAWLDSVAESDLCSVWHSPLILDIGGNGLALQGPESGVRFDMQANGVKIQTGWVRANSDDAFLVRDVNQNGIIDDGSELFGNATRLLDGTQAATGSKH